MKDEEVAMDDQAVAKPGPDSDCVTQTDPEQPTTADDTQSKPHPPSGPAPAPAATTPQATDTKTAAGSGGDPTPDASKDPSSSSSPSSTSPIQDTTTATIQGLLDIHANPPLEHILPNSEPPLVGVD